MKDKIAAIQLAAEALGAELVGGPVPPMIARVRHPLLIEAVIRYQVNSELEILGGEPASTQEIEGA